MHLRTSRRRASVLILVVAVLVLLALVGTAFIATTRTDRYASRQHVHNVHGDMAVQSAVNMVLGELSTDLFANPGTAPFNYVTAFREPAVEGSDVGAFEYWDGIGDALIGPRVPVLLNTTPSAAVTSLYPATPPRRLFPFDPDGINPPVWTGHGNIPTLPRNLVPQWSSPYRDWIRATRLPVGSPEHRAPTARPYLGNPLWPHLQLYYGGHPFDADPSTPSIDPVPAADADGDGVADSFLWKLPTGPMNNVTYYAAVRVVDNNSAINVNTALSRDWDFDGAGKGIPAVDVAGKAIPAASYFTGRVGIAEMLQFYEPGGQTIPTIRTMGVEFLRLTAYRLNPGPSIQVPGVRGASGVYVRPYDDTGKSRSDFQFLSVADALERQLTSRIGNPGNAAGQAKYRPFTLSDSMALAYPFCLDSGTSPTHLERLLAGSLFTYARSSGPRAPVPKVPYDANATAEWIERFRYDREDPYDYRTFRDLRALLVARNPVANHAPAPYAETDVNGDGDRNDMATTITGSGDPISGDVLALPTAAVPPYVGMEPFNRQPGRTPVRPVPRVSINTATFPELWRGFWSVMTPDGVRAKQSPVLLTAVDSFLANRFALDPADPFAPKNFLTADEHHPNLMFRSGIRAVPTPGVRFPKAFAAGTQMLLRAALAAVNAEDLRDADRDVTSRLIQLHVVGDVYGPVEKVAVRVYGTERQPYITEVYVNTDDRPGPAGGATNPKGYVAVELHNPYDEDIPLSGDSPRDGWSLGLIDRRPRVLNGPEVLNLRELGENPGESPNAVNWRFGPAADGLPTVVPANGYLVLENYDPDVAGTESGAARYRPVAAQRGGLAATGAVETGPVRTAYVPNLHRVLQDPVEGTSGGELVLLRTRRADCTSEDHTGQSIDPYNEVANLSDLVPVDQFDFTGVALPAAPPDGTAKRYTAVHYVRANGPGAEWRFVYPGRYDGLRASQRHQGMVQAEFGGDKPDPFDPAAAADPAPAAVPPVLLGAADPAAHQNQVSLPIQLAAIGWPGPNPLGRSGNAYPFGIFGRLADILQVPFIGAYTVYVQATPGGPPTAELYEMNAVTIDSAFAEDGDRTDDPQPNADPRDQREQVGRFCPVHVHVPLLLPGARPVIRVDDYVGTTRYSGAYPSLTYRFVPPPVPGEPPPPPSYETSTLPADRVHRFRYRWAMDLFDHFTVQAPHNDFFPNVAPSRYTVPRRTPGVPAVNDPINPSPQAVANSGGTAGNSDPVDVQADGSRFVDNDYAEDYEPLEGLVNINTAPWKVLAALPMVLDAGGTVNVTANAELAKAIVYFRDTDSGYRNDTADRAPVAHGPFKSLFELNEVVDTRPDALRNLSAFPGPGSNYGFRNGYGTIDLNGGADPDVRAGDTSPGVPNVTDGVRGDFEEYFLVLNRISNLITTRSDSFTCYVYVMGVEHDGTPQAALKVQRRVAFIADRSAVRPLRPVVRTQFISNE